MPVLPRGWLIALVLVIGLCAGSGHGAAPPRRLTAEQKEQLKQCDRLAKQAAMLGRQGKLDEKVAVLQKKLVIERAVFVSRSRPRISLSPFLSATCLSSERIKRPGGGIAATLAQPGQE